MLNLRTLILGLPRTCPQTGLQNEPKYSEKLSEFGTVNWTPQKINELIHADGYEFYIDHIVSNRIAYGWRRKDDKFRIIKKAELYSLIGLFNRGGYVLDFSTSGFDDFTQDIVGIRLTGYYGLSKGKSLAAFAEEGKENDIIKLIVALFDYYVSNPTYDNEKNGIAYKKYQNTIERIRLGIVAMNEFAKELEQRFSSEYMSSQISIMMKMTKENPTEAIGKAKELIESCCKTIMEERKVQFSQDDSVGQLTRKVMKLLKVTPHNIDDKLPAAEAMKKILGNLSAIAEGMATLRNNYGSGHGKPASYKGLEERHAKLAVGSSITLVEFLWCTHERTKNDTKFQMLVMNIHNLIGEATAYDKKLQLEVKRPKSWLKSVSAFANGEGGTLVFGISDDD